MSQNPSKFSKALQFGARLERYISNIALLDLWLAAIGNICIERKVNKPKKTSVLREAFKNYLADFFPLRGYPPPPTPLTENQFAKKPLAERGGYPPPLNRKLPKIFLKKWVKKG